MALSFLIGVSIFLGKDELEIKGLTYSFFIGVSRFRPLFELFCGVCRTFYDDLFPSLVLLDLFCIACFLF